MVNLPFKELANVFEGFGWNPVKARRLPFFELVNGFLDFAEFNRIVD